MCVSSMATMNNKQKWTKTFKRLQAYQQEHNGSCNVPQKYRSDPQLGTWVKTQRCRYKKGLLTSETNEKINFKLYVALVIVVNQRAGVREQYGIIFQ